MKTKASQEKAIQFCKYFVDARAVFHRDPNAQCNEAIGDYMWKIMFIEQRTRDRNNPQNTGFTNEFIDGNFASWKIKPLHSIK